jgi:hypothetical protein
MSCLYAGVGTPSTAPPAYKETALQRRSNQEIDVEIGCIAVLLDRPEAKPDPQLRPSIPSNLLPSGQVRG